MKESAIRSAPASASLARTAPGAQGWRRRAGRAGRGGGSLDHPVRAHEKRLRKSKAKPLCVLQVDYQLELCRLLDRQVAGFRALENAIDVMGRATKVPFGVVAVS